MEGGWYHVTARGHNTMRYYDPISGRYLSRDPIWEDGGINLYCFVLNSPLTYYNPIGLAYFALRPFSRLPLPVFSNPLDNWLNTELYHEQLFFEDGKTPGNIGYFEDSTLRSDDASLLSGYHKTKSGYNDCSMRIAVAQTMTKSYSLIGGIGKSKFNCQDYAAAVRRTYSELVKDQNIVRKCCVKKDEIK